MAGKLTKDTKFYIDAHVNEGFSGGPLVFVPNGRPPSSHDKFKVAGVVANLSYPKHAIEMIEQNPIGFPLEAQP